MSYSEKLLHNYQELSLLERIRYQYTSKKLMGKDSFFFEGCKQIPGQMYLAERRILYTTLISRRPAQSFEIGTYLGGGSTYFSASAFAQIGSGQIVTLEADADLIQLARKGYNKFNPSLLSFIRFEHGDTAEVFLPYIREAGNLVECFFLDGSDDPQQTLSQFDFFMSYVKPGSVMMAHDWDTQKMTLLKQQIQKCPNWQLRHRLSAPASVGFVVYIYE